MNDAVYNIAYFMVMRNPVTWRWSHARHHTDTYIVGRDPEIAFMRPPDLMKLGWPSSASTASGTSCAILLGNAAGKLRPRERLHPRKRRGRRFSPRGSHIAIYAATSSPRWPTLLDLPLMLIGLPRIYGAWHMVMTGLLQHGGLAENVSTTG